MDHVTAIFNSRFEADQALRALENVGITPSDISMLMSDDARSSHFKIEEGNKADEGAAAGATFGGILGGVTAALLSAGALAIPGLNLVVSGSIIAGMAGLGAGAATGGLLGALIGAGFKENEAKLYEKELYEGNILMAVQTHNGDQKRAVQDILKLHSRKPEDISRASQIAADGKTTGTYRA